MYREEDRINQQSANSTGADGEETPRDEMLLDVCLEEIFSGQTPPDLTAPILAALPMSPANTAVPLAEPPLAEPPPVAPPVAAPPVQTQQPGERAPAGNDRAPSGNEASGNGQPADAKVMPVRVPSATTALRQRQRAQTVRQWLGLAVAASVLAVGIGVGAAALRWSYSQGAGEVAQRHNASPRSDQAVARDPHVEPTRSEHDASAVSPFDQTLFGANFPDVPAESAVPWELPYAVERQPDGQVVRFVNQHVRNSSPSEAGSVALDDDQWCRRVYRQVLGRDPSSEELVDFATSRSPAKRQQLVDQLLTADKYREEFAQHWARQWTNELLGPEVAGAQGELANREALQRYLQEAYRAGKPHDELAAELISATGAALPGSPQFNGATNFVLSGIHDKKAKLAATVGRVFLGHEGQCAQCHDATANQKQGLTQQQFWQLAAFFQQAEAERDDSGQVHLVNSDFVGPTGAVEEAELFFRTPDRQRRIAYPVFIDGTPINPDGRVDVVDRRAELAKLIVRSEEFSTATVSQYWEELLGEPVDKADIVADRPELVRGLAEQFAAHNYEPKRLIRWIVLSDANLQPDVNARRTPLYENVASALHDVTVQGRPMAMGDQILLGRVANIPGGEANDPSIYVRTSGDASSESEAPSDFVREINASDMAIGAKIEHIFLHTLARRPTDQEMSAARRLLSSHEGNSGTALEDLWWAITNSAEFAAR